MLSKAAQQEHADTILTDVKSRSSHAAWKAMEAWYESKESRRMIATHFQKKSDTHSLWTKTLLQLPT